MLTTQARRRTDQQSGAGPLRALLAGISNKWAATILETLSETRELSYGQLQRQTTGVSRKMLSATLRDLVRDGLVQRRPDTRHIPQRVYYSLTELGKSLVATLGDLRAWAVTNMDVTETARNAYHSCTDD